MKKRMSVFILTLVLILGTGLIESEDKLRILVYEISSYPVLGGPLFESTGKGGFANAAKALGERASLDIRWSPSLKVNYSILKRYDVLIIVPYYGTINSEERDAIKEFVRNGGGLLFLGDSFPYDMAIPAAFDVTFSERWIFDTHAEQFLTSNQFYVSDIASHPITEHVEQITLDYAYPIKSYKEGFILARTGSDSQTKLERGPFDILLAIDEIGKGRAVFFDLSSFSNWVINQPHQQNLKLLTNAVAWLGEPGGPYREYSVLNEEAQQLLIDAQSLFNNHDFLEAKNTFKEAIRLFGESNEYYSNSEAFDGIDKAVTGITLCDIGIEADQIFQNAESLFVDGKYEEAFREFEEAQLLYGEIKYSERVDECTLYIDESNTRIALIKEATHLFNEAEKAFESAASTFWTGGFKEAKSLYDKAGNAWEEFDPGKAAACQEKIIMCNKEIARIKRNRIIISCMIVGALGVIIQVIRQKRSTMKEYS